ncbi:MAG TPA: amidohydrolase family protein [Pseudonocardiaceae bacterium]|nr:amidohydrolase family protein [Pseudonocardiaceae bacterium]
MRVIEAGTLLAVRASRLFDGDRGFGPSTVLVSSGRIVDVDTTGAAPPAHADVLDLGDDVCLLPGLIDAHVHLAFNASADVVGGLAAVDDAKLLDQMAWAARQALQAGITTVRDLGDRSFLALRLRDRLDAWGDPGPHILASGPPITIRSGHCHFLGGVAAGVQALRAAVRERAERGCEVVTVMVSGGHLTPGSCVHDSQYSLADLRLITTEAHRLGLRTAAYVHNPRSVADAVAAGVDTLEHVTFRTPDGVDADAATVDAIAESGAVVSVPVGDVPGRQDMPASIARRLEIMIDSWARLHRHGVRIVPGTDAGISPSKPHDVLPYGLTALGGLGMTNLEALRAATSVAADACGLTGRKGRLTPGADADLLAVTGDPLADIHAVHDVAAVMQGGRWTRRG